MENSNIIYNSYSGENYIYNYTDYIYNYADDHPVEEVVFKNNKTCFKEKLCATLFFTNVIIFLLGISGNIVVIWIAGFKMKKTVNTTWYLSLAVSDFLFCACLPFNITHTVTDTWNFGVVVCKLASFVMFLNMFSSIFLLVIISADRCLSVIFPVWAQNHRTNQKASVIVVVAWLLSVGLSTPSLVYRHTAERLGRTVCYNKYTAQNSHQVVAVTRFVGGFVLPFLFIMICYSVIIVRLRTNRMTRSSKPFKVMSGLIGTFFLCWLPYHVFVLLEMHHHLYDLEVIHVGLQVGTTLATANSFLNPVLYVFMGNDFKQKFRISILSKMANAMGEEGRTSSRYLSRSSSMDGRGSTHI